MFNNRMIHLLSLGCIAVALSLTLKASVHAQANPTEVDQKFQEWLNTTPTSAHGVSGTITLSEVTLVSGVKTLESSSNTDHQAQLINALRPEIHRQLQYLVGSLHGIEGGLELHAARVYDLIKVDELSDGLARFTYSAEINGVIVSSAAPPPNQSDRMTVFLPSRVDSQSLNDIFDLYGADCNPNPLRSYNPEVFWYDFRPNAYYCPLRTWSGDSDPELFVRAEAIFEAQPSSERETYPEYDRIWSDGRLVVTAVYALVGGLLGEQGEEAYKMVFEDLVRTYGEPMSINNPLVLQRGQINTNTPVIRAIFDTPQGTLELNMFLVNTLDQPSHVEGDELRTFTEDYQRLTEYSDLIIYNGHAHHGADNAKLDALGNFIAGQYQLFFVNTCASYTYGLPRVQRRIFELNQDAAQPESFLDMIVNGMPAMGHEIAYMNLRYINALMNAEESYQDILSSLYAKQQMVVLYDQDNLWRPDDNKLDRGTVTERAVFGPARGDAHPTQVNQGCESTLNPLNQSRSPSQLLGFLGLMYLIVRRRLCL